MNVMIDEPLIAKHELEVVHMGRTCQNIQLFPGLDQSRSVNSIQEVARLACLWEVAVPSSGYA